MKSEIGLESPVDHCANCHSANLSTMLNGCIECKQYSQQSHGSRSATTRSTSAGVEGHDDHPEECMCADCWSYLHERIVARLAELNE
jgi:hypothetical protein